MFMGKVAGTREVKIPAMHSPAVGSHNCSPHGSGRRGGRAEIRAPQPSSPGFSMGQPPRASRIPDDKRGPGAYMSIWDHSQGSAYSFCGKGTRGHKKDCEGSSPCANPSGLGHYATKCSAPAYSMGARYGPSASPTTPAPGKYDAVGGCGTAGANGVSFTTAYRSNQGSSSGPGPGSYSTNTMATGPSYSMGIKSSTRTESRNLSPGPAAYDLTRKSSGPAFSIAPKMRRESLQRDASTRDQSKYI